METFRTLDRSCSPMIDSHVPYVSKRPKSWQYSVSMSERRDRVAVAKAGISAARGDLSRTRRNETKRGGTGQRVGLIPEGCHLSRRKAASQWFSWGGAAASLWPAGASRGQSRFALRGHSGFGIDPQISLAAWELERVKVGVEVCVEKLGKQKLERWEFCPAGHDWARPCPVMWGRNDDDIPRRRPLANEESETNSGSIGGV